MRNRASRRDVAAYVRRCFNSDPQPGGAIDEPAARRWALYEVRRIFVRPGRTLEAVRVLAAGTRQAMWDAVNRKFFDEEFTGGTSINGIDRAWFAHRGRNDRFPAAEGFVVAAPHVVKERVRGSMAAFDERFEHARHGLWPRKPPKVGREDTYFGV